MQHYFCDNQLFKVFADKVQRVYIGNSKCVVQDFLIDMYTGACESPKFFFHQMKKQTWGYGGLYIPKRSKLLPKHFCKALLISSRREKFVPRHRRLLQRKPEKVFWKNKAKKDRTMCRPIRGIVGKCLEGMVAVFESRLLIGQFR